MRPGRKGSRRPERLSLSATLTDWTRFWCFTCPVTRTGTRKRTKSALEVRRMTQRVEGAKRSEEEFLPWTVMTVGTIKLFNHPRR